MSGDRSIVLINSSNYKAGFGGDDAPRAVFPSVVGRPRTNGISVQAIVGDEALAKRGILSLNYPIKNKLVTNWDDMEKLWHHAFFEELKVSPNDYDVLIGDSIFSSKGDNEKTAQIMFETFNVNGFYRAETTRLSLYAASREEGVSVQSGSSRTVIVPYFESKAVKSAIKTLDIGGDAVVTNLVNILSERGYIFTTTAEREIVRDIMHKLSYVAFDYEIELKKSKSTDMERSYELPDGQIITIGSELYRAPEIFFQPTLCDLEVDNLSNLINQSISLCDVDKRSKLYSNIVLSGGSTLFEGMSSRLIQEIEVLAAGKKKVKIIAPPERKYSSWIGGSIVSSHSNTFNSQIITQSEYNEIGPSVVHRLDPSDEIDEQTKGKRSSEFEMSRDWPREEQAAKSDARPLTQADAADGATAVEAATDDVAGNIQQAFLKGRKEWGRSKIMIVGEGRAGKSAFANTIIGRKFEDTESTVGINQLTCDIKYASIGSGNGWAECSKPTKELEAAVASMIANGIKPDKSKLEPHKLDGNDKENSGEEHLLDNEEASQLFDLRSQLRKVDRSDAREQVAQKSNSVMSADTGVVHASVGKYMNEHAGGDLEDDLAELDESEAKAYDSDLIMKCLADKLQTESKFVLSVFDFGGQSVFNVSNFVSDFKNMFNATMIPKVIHHFFLTRYGVYTVVFNMEWLVGGDIDVASRCLSTLKFWINSIVIHTLNPVSNETAPIVLIGTRKDKISKPSDHQRISTILYENFASSLAWANVIENENAVGANGRASLFFYPVDNVEGRSDPTVVACMKDIEKVIDESDYVHKEQPLVYLQALDKMFLLKKAFLSFDEAAGVAIKCGVPLAGVTHMLKLFHEMGMLMFHDEPELRNVVILDPISYFVSPVTLIICKHVPTDSDPTHHLLDVHKMCRKKKHAQWQKMTNYGVVDTDLLRLLLNEHADNVNQLVRLMTKFGLLVRLQSSDSNESASDMLDSDEYLVPALLPVNVSKDFLWSDQSFSTCYLVFTTSTDFANFTTISGNDLRLYGFLPKGLFERLLGKAVTWAQHTSANHSVKNFSLTQDVAILSFGSQRFRLYVHEDMSTIEINIEGRNPRAVLTRLMEQIQVIIDECMKSLIFFAALTYSSRGDCNSNNSLVFDDDRFLIPMKQIQSVVESHSVLNRPGGRRLLTEAEAKSYFNAWLKGHHDLKSFDLFLSYRWGANDSTFVQSIYDRSSLYTLEDDNREVVVFLDKEWLHEGRQFQSEFAQCLRNARVVVPIISSDALMRFCSSDESIEDNVMVEWLMSMECYANPALPLKRIFPIFFGSRLDVFGKIGNLFKDDSYKCLPEKRPTASIELAARLLRENGIEPRPEMFESTAASVVNKMKKFLCVFAWNISNPDFLTKECVDQIMQVVRSSLSDSKSYDAILPASAAVSATSAPITTVQSLPLKRCIDILREQLCIETTAMGAVVEEALALLGDPALTAHCNSLSSLLLKVQYLVSAGIGYTGS